MKENDFTPPELNNHEIIERYEAQKLKDKPIFDFLPFIVGVTQVMILEKWAKFFRNKSVPFIIARKPASLAWQKGMHTYSLWKERYVF